MTAKDDAVKELTAHAISAFLDIQKVVKAHLPGIAKNFKTLVKANFDKLK